ncbi:DUF3231 family protein [Alkalihalobacillus sp. AL-G]|uniref:DUF3231 family protein n=1 Tax=Alkalihalobacillus sp. AL-G TaxID=2926399 RepID=UPI00272A0FD1|nr:DUF3231 family protein [Alkalihalobacillus sp. AL-G]WLD92371.1 DUF3231 family protein [Alkalihalobacillus sp. AL-G]
MGMFSGNPKKEPLHYGEVIGLWTSLSTAKSSVVAYQVYYNHAGDEDLKRFIEDLIKNLLKPAIEEVESILKKNQVALPPSPPERSEANTESIPVGARINDPEVAMAISKDIAQGLVADSGVIGQCIREDIALMFGQFHAKKAQMGARLLQINKEKGWLIPPPLHKDRENND